MVEQNVTEFGMKHHWVKGNQFNLYKWRWWPPGARGVDPNRGNLQKTTSQ